MKDLKHLIEFEDLLRDANNALVQQAVADGRHALGFNCYFIPEVLLNLPGCFSVRLRAPGIGTTDVGTYYMTNKTCPYARSILERGLEGGYNFLSALISAETCQMMHRAHEHFEMLGLVKDVHPDFYLTMMDVPFMDDADSIAHYERQLEKHLLGKLSEVYHVDVSDEALRAAIASHNELCRIITELGELRKQDNPPITGYEFHVLQLVSQVCPQDLILPKLKETLAEVKRRKPDPKPWYRSRIVVVGSEVDDPEFTKLLESCGAFVVADRYCFGAVPGREEIQIFEGETPLHAVARHYLTTSQCPRFMEIERAEGRRAFVKRLAEEYRADGILYLQMKFCEFWSYERVLAVQELNDEMGIPTIGIEKEYSMASAGQIRTRIQAFVESLEIKQIQGGKQG